MHTPSAAPLSLSRGGIRYRLRRVEAWLDSKGRGAWIAAMVAGFLLFWPVGLALVFYITWTNRWSKDMFAPCTARRHRHDSHGMGVYRPSGNAAFDAYKSETLRRLEDEQLAFETFLQRLRAAKDKAEFDSFMEDRAREVRVQTPEEDVAPAARTGAPDAPDAPRRGEY